ncbi:MAG: lysophospholipase [Clostridiales bacterium]|nr:lysophospholipase [Clostridiales bacterium]
MWWIILIVLGVILILMLILAVNFAKLAMEGKRRQTLEQALNWQSERYDTSFYTNSKRDEYTVESYDGYILHAELLKAPDNSSKYMIISHGYTDNRIGSLKYAKMYLKLGFNCVIYDLRGHGENERTFTTYSIRESKDLAAMIEDTRKRYPDISVLGLQGESLGAASTIASLKYEPDVDFAVADCGFARIWGVIETVVRQAHAPAFAVKIADIGARIRYHYALSDMRPIDALDNNTVPVLFIHGEADDFIVPQNSRDMFERTKGIKELHLIPGANHAQSMLNEPDEYEKIVKNFIGSLTK